MALLPWLPLLASVAHMTEEFVWPGGFIPWYRRYRPKIAASVTPSFLFKLNAAQVGAATAAGLVGMSPRGAAFWLTLVALLGGNGLFHVIATVRGRQYSPGVVTGVLLYVPLAVIGYTYVLRHHLASGGSAIVAAALGLSYPLLSTALHRRRVAQGPAS